MAETLFLGAIVGNAVGQLLRVILELKDKAGNFQEHLEQLQNTLETVIPLFEEGRKLDLELNGRNSKALLNLIEKLGKGEKLVQKCCKVRSWNFFVKIRYSSKISSLDEAIRRFCGLELQVENWRDKKLLLKKMEELTLHVVQSPQPRLGSDGNKGLFAVPELPDLVVGFDTALRELKFELFKENVTVLGVCAPGGCGKSTLAAMLCQDEQVKSIFKGGIFFVTVSRTPTSTFDILHRLLEMIGGGVPLACPSEENASKQFRNLLEKRNSEPFLLVLDDVWNESIIEKFFSRAKGYKLLVTSRETFHIYNTKHHSKYLLRPLSHQDSMTLFSETALSQDGNEDYKPDKDLLNEIVRCCGGFPLAITVIAKSLSLQPAVKWRSVASKLSKGSSILNFDDEKLWKRLATSLDFLDNTVLDCFLDLGPFPENKRIPASALFDIWCELYDVEDEDEALTILLELASRNLVNLVGSRNFAKEIDASFNELFVTQHNLLRDLAIYQNRQQRSKRIIINKRKKGLPVNWREQENQYLNAHIVSLCTGEMCSKSWYDLQLPEVEVLILNLSASNCALPPFTKNMRKLKVLMIANHGRTRAQLSNLMTLCELTNLKRIRLEKVSIPSLHEFTMPLTNLKKISLVMCDFGQALMKCTIKASYMLPNLVEINIDYCHGLAELPPWICDIINLQTLSITNCDSLSVLPERIGCITDLELLRLHACTGLPKLPDSIKGLQKLRFLDISDCCNLKMLPDGMGELHCLEKLDVRGCIELSELHPSVMNLAHLEVVCNEDTASLWEPLSSSPKITVLRKDNSLVWLGVDI